MCMQVLYTKIEIFCEFYDMLFCANALSRHPTMRTAHLESHTFTAAPWSVAAVLLSCQALANWQDALPGAQILGSGEFRMFGFDVYSARLWSTSRPLADDQPFALELIYQRSISRDDLVNASVGKSSASPAPRSLPSNWRLAGADAPVVRRRSGRHAADRRLSAGAGRAVFSRPAAAA